jgi:hypothetical protein
MEQAAPNLPNGEVEGQGMEERPNIMLIKMEPFGGCAQQARNIGVCHHHALGLAGRARGIDYIGQILQIGVWLDLRIVFTWTRRVVPINT